MKKEHFLIIAVLLLLISYALDYIAGPVSITVKNPIEFFSAPIAGKFPLTTFAVVLRVIGLFVGTLLVYSFIEHKYFTKAFLSIFMGVVAEFYAIQQLSTGGRFTPIQWTLAFAYVGALLFPIAVIYIIKGIYHIIAGSFSEPKTDYPEPILPEEEKE
jgi:hypothetical protein